MVDYTVNIRFHNYLMLLLVAVKPVKSAAVLRDLHNSKFHLYQLMHLFSSYIKIT